MDIRITLDLSENLAEALRGVCAAIGGKAAASVTWGENFSPVRPEVSEDSERQETPVSQGLEAPAPSSPAPVATTAEEPKWPDDAEMRGCMDIAIAKFCGAGWRESSDPKVLSLRRQCTAIFRDIAKTLGAEKPTQLKGEERVRFCEYLDNIMADAKTGELTCIPF